MYDCANIGSPIVVFVDAGGFGGIAYALHVEHPIIINLEPERIESMVIIPCFFDVLPRGSASLEALTWAEQPVSRSFTASRSPPAQEIKDRTNPGAS